MSDRRTVYRVCTTCESACGLAVDIEGDTVVAVRGDAEDPFSKGYVCPKAPGLKGLHEDPDRLRRPVRRTADGWEEITWDEAYAATAAALLAAREAGGVNAVGIFRGNPASLDFHSLTYFPMLEKALGTQNFFTADTLCAHPRFVQAGLMYGNMLHAPVPDIDRTDYALLLGANPVVSNGSLATGPDWPGRLQGLRERGGTLVVIDPRRTETADLATEHHFIRPGTDACFLLAMVHTMLEEGLVALGKCAELVEGLETVRTAVSDFAPEAVAAHCAVPAETIRRLTREFCAADRAVCYGRLGVSVQEFGTLANWGVDLLNILSGNLDRPGGAMFAKPAAYVGFAVGEGGEVTFDRFRSRVHGYGETYGQLPAAALADEIETPGHGQIRALIVIAGNPVCSSVHAARLDRALASLDFMVAVDYYINETTKHAHIILPPTSPLERDAYPVGLYHFATRNVAKWGPAAFEPEPEAQHAWQIVLTLAKHLMGMAEIENSMVDAFVLSQYAELAIPVDTPWEDLSPDEAVEALGEDPGPARLLDMILRVGPYGDGFGRNPEGLTLAKVQAEPHGIDLGPLQERLPEDLPLPNGRITLAPDRMVHDLDRLRESMTRDRNGQLLLIGRREPRSINSWLHNIPALAKGRDRCTLWLSETDAAALKLETGARARIESRVGSVVAPVEVTDQLMPGVVSLPHGWGHDADGARLRVASAHPGVNANILTDDLVLDAPSGASALFGIPVTVTPVPAS